MRALLGCFLVLSLAVSPAMAGTNGSEDTKAASTTGTSTTTAAPAATSTPAATAAAKPAASSMETELNELRDQMDSQARQIQEQNDRLKAEQEKMKALEQQLKTANSSSESLNASPAAAAASGSSSSATVASASVPAASSSSSQPAPAAQEKGGAADVPSPLSFKIGGAQFTPGGFGDAMNVFRSTDNGCSIGTSFGGVLYNTAANYPLAGLTEDRFSLQNSRVSLRVDGNLAGGKAVGYLETDFLGNAATTIFVTSNSDTLRLRLFFLDYTRNKFEFLAGQDWSMLTSNRNGIGFMPADIFFTNDVDTNYQLGLVWQRTAQVRFLYHFSKTAVAGISLENPEQFIGSGLITAPSGVSLNQFDTNGGSGGTTNTPNLVPDIVAKIALDPMFGKLHEHFEVAGIARTFRVNTFTAATPTVPQSSVNMKTEGAGVAVNSNLEVFKNFHIIENAFWSDGDGRDIIGLIPDVVIRPLLPATAGGSPAYTLSPVHAGSFIAGFEYTMNKTQFYGYTSGVYAANNFVRVGPGPNCLSTGTTCPGYGQPQTAANVSIAESNNRYMQEHTLGIIQTFWRNPQYGAIQLMIQASYIGREPWWVVPGTPTNAHLGMAYVDFRYTLP